MQAWSELRDWRLIFKDRALTISDFQFVTGNRQIGNWKSGMTALIVHGHFYQPPRENPFTGEVENEPSARPYHDWNERIHSESYGPNAFARIGGDVPEHVVNNYENISFNFGPTLLSWLQKHQPR